MILHVYDAVIGQRAMFGDGVPGTMFAKNDSSKSVASTVSGSMSSLSSLGPSDSVSQAGNGRAVTDLVEAQGMQMKELMEALKSVRDTVGDLNRRVSSYQGDDTKMRCLKCGEMGHRAKDCPTKKKKPQEADGE